MYFGTNDIMVEPNVEIDKEWSALDRIDSTLSEQNGLFFKNGDYSLQALMVMIDRLNTKPLNTDEQVIDCHDSTRLLILEFIMNMTYMINPEIRLWKYDYKARGLPRDDKYWRHLFASSKNDDFELSNVWTLYDRKQTEDHLGQKKTVC